MSRDTVLSLMLNNYLWFVLNAFNRIVIEFLLLVRVVPTLPSMIIYVQPEVSRRFLSPTIIFVGIVDILSIQSDSLAVVTACECVRCFVLIPVDLGLKLILIWIVHLFKLLLDLSQP